MKKTALYLSFLLLIAFATVSCIRDEIAECPPLTVSLTVIDKNYFNVDKVELEDALPTDLPFKEYVPTLYYTLRNLATGEYVEDSGVFEVDGDSEDFRINFCDCLPHGTYVLTVWGGLDDEDPLEDDPLTINFHPVNNIGNDIYLTNDTIVYDIEHHDYTFEMERTKGKLLILLENLPEGYENSTKKVDNLYSRVDNDFNYYEATHIDAASEWSGNTTVTQAFLTPSIGTRASRVSVEINHTDEDYPPLLPSDVKITINRNELTVLRYTWDDIGGNFDVYILVNDNWELVHGMELEPIE